MSATKTARAVVLRFIKPADVTWGTTVTRLGRPSNRSSRAEGPSTLTLELVHLPSGVRVSGEVPVGHYSRGQMIAKREELRMNLWSQLDDAVARKLRLPGR